MSSLLSNLIFPAPTPSYNMHSFPDELIWIPSKGDTCLEYGKCRAGDCIPALMLQCNAARYLVLYLHSNGEDIGLAHSFGYGLRMVLEVHVLLIEYPGYGISPGECSEDSIWNAAVAALRFIIDVLKWPMEDVIIMGRSLGAAVAMRLACTYDCHGLILIAPFLSLVDAAAQYVGILAPMIVGNAFCNREHITHVKAPTLVIHGLNDRLIPCVQGQQLWELCPHHKKLFVCPEQMSHNSDLLSNAEFLIRPMLRFFALPDYSFVELNIPAEAFDKRHCPQYHKLIEMTKDDAPLLQPQGDQEPPPAQTTMCGPQSSAKSDAIKLLGGDMDMPDGCEEDTLMKTPRNSPRPAMSPRGSTSRYSHEAKKASASTSWDLPESTTAPRSAADFEPPILEVEPRPIEPVRRMVSHRSPVQTRVVGSPEEVLEGEAKAEMEQRLAWQQLAMMNFSKPKSGPLCSEPAAHVPADPEACNAAGGAANSAVPVRPQPVPRLALEQGLPGFQHLDIDSGISRFLHESNDTCESL